MIINRDDNGIILVGVENYNLDKIIRSGQCFRWSKLSEYYYYGVVDNDLLIIQKLSDNDYKFYCTESEFYQKWFNYFDFNRDYNEINQFILDKAEDDQFVRKSVEVANGIRILHQDPWEMVVTFILSQQNNIPRIRLIVDRLCEELGNQFCKSGRYYCSFPSAEVVNQHESCIYHDIGAGFRDEYIVSTAARWMRYKPDDSSYDVLIKSLKKYHGIGDKIANCIALFGYGYTQAFPMDVWMNRILDTYYEDRSMFDKNKYGIYAGIVQQYMYYYARLLEDRA